MHDQYLTRTEMCVSKKLFQTIQNIMYILFADNINKNTNIDSVMHP